MQAERTEQLSVSWRNVLTSQLDHGHVGEPSGDLKAWLAGYRDMDGGAGDELSPSWWCKDARIKVLQIVYI